MTHINLTFRERIAVLRWALPFLFGLLAVLYEIGPGRWIHDRYSPSAYFDLDIVFYAFIAPLLMFAALTVVHGWLEEIDRAEKQARASQQQLAAIMTASADAIIGLDLSGRIKTWNRGAELIFGYTASQISGQPLSTLFRNGDAAEVEFRWLAAQVQHIGFLRGHETTCRDAQQREIAVELTATHVADLTGQSIGMSVILRDITERKHRDAEIRRLNASLNEQVAERTRELAEKVEQLARANTDLKQLDQMRTEFVSVVSHQIRAPLTNMRGAVERMEHGCAVINTTCTRMFVILEQQASRLERLVQDVLSASRIEAGQLALQLEPMSVSPVVQQVIDQTRARTTDRAVQFVNKPGLPLVLADRDRVAEVLANLLDNADKYSPCANEIVIEVRADQTEFTVSVRDHGRGIPSKDLERVFDKFYRSDGSDSQAAYGYGLGLYVCHQLIKAQGGHIWAENASDGGAVFSFTLPVAP